MKAKKIEKIFRVDPYENKMLKEKSKEAKISEAEFLRNCILNKEIDYVLRKAVFDILYELRKIGTNINQIAHIANSTNQIMENKYETNYKELMKIIEELRKKLR